MKFATRTLDSPVSLLDNSDMSKFSDWVDSKYRRATELAEHFGVSRSFISNIKAGRKPVPKNWYRPLVELSGGELTLVDLVPNVPVKS